MNDVGSLIKSSVRRGQGRQHFLYSESHNKSNVTSVGVIIFFSKFKCKAGVGQWRDKHALVALTVDPQCRSPACKQNKDGPEEKKDADGELWGNVEAQAAFLGPNLWDKTLPYDADLKVLNHYVDLDEFLSENGIPVDGVGGGVQGSMQPGQLHKLNNPNEAGSHQGPAGLHLEPVTKRERSPSPSDCCSPDTLNPPSPADSTLSMASSGRDFDPRTRAFSDEELKPQPMIKKSRKQFVPDDLKDDKYWARRRKNNMAAKRSRDARRMKENQIALRAGFLEKENMGLRQELDRLKNENMLLRDKLSKYTDV
ncbi:hypothetical protein KQX54_019784 [Cotesia glomerata]|uniref:BZIP domain-containing protein n=1 Tax=Cotesia glomerata TaxID=32391 RepID=A0AAV7HXF6_COTGL|nr:hypothetical protein KQX54_019784 [Cotesia glomerata]